VKLVPYDFFSNQKLWAGKVKRPGEPTFPPQDAVYHLRIAPHQIQTTQHLVPITCNLRRHDNIFEATAEDFAFKGNRYYFRIQVQVSKRPTIVWQPKQTKYENKTIIYFCDI
jgi:hypothetical protein